MVNEDKPETKSHPKLSEIAADWGTSTAYVSKKQKAYGKKFESLEEARTYRDTTAKEGIGHKSKAQAKPEQLDITALLANTTDEELSLEANLKRTRQIELMAFKLLNAAAGAGEFGKVSFLQRSYTAASKDRMALEAKAIEAQMLSREVVKLIEVFTMINRIFGPLQTKLIQYPRTMAKLINPENPDVVEAILEEGIKSELQRIQNELLQIRDELLKQVKKEASDGTAKANL